MKRDDVIWDAKYGNIERSKEQETRMEKSTTARNRPAEESKRNRLETNRYTNMDRCIARVATAWKKDIAHRILGELLTFRKEVKAAKLLFSKLSREDHKIMTEDSAWWNSQYCCKGNSLEVFLRTVDYGDGYRKITKRTVWPTSDAIPKGKFENRWAQQGEWERHSPIDQQKSKTGRPKKSKIETMSQVSSEGLIAAGRWKYYGFTRIGRINHRL